MPEHFVRDRTGCGASRAPRAGADLRAARERVGWSLQEMAAALHIRPQYLEALEAGRISELPGNAYALGFLRTYAGALGLDPNEIARRFKAEAAAVDEKTELTFPVPAPERGVPAGAVVLLGVVLAVGAYVGWYRLSGEGRLPAETSMQIPLRLAPLADQAVRPSATPVVASVPAPVAPPRCSRRRRRRFRQFPPVRPQLPRWSRRRLPTNRPTNRASCSGRVPTPGCRYATAPARSC